MNRPLLNRLQDLRARGLPAALVTRIADGTTAVVCSEGVTGALTLDAESRAEIDQCIRADRSALLGSDLFVRPYNPPLRLILVGAVHIAQSLVPLAEALGVRVTIIDPRTAFASAGRFPQVRLVHEWPDLALEQLKPDARTAIVTLTHDPKLDDPALATALRTDAFFIGALGSRKTHAARLDRLQVAGFSATDLERIHAPVGLPLGGRRPAEIALAVMAQIVSVLNHPQ